MMVVAYTPHPLRIETFPIEASEGCAMIDGTSARFARCVAFIERVLRPCDDASGCSHILRVRPLLRRRGVQLLAKAVDWYFMIAAPTVLAVIALRATGLSRR
jgi:hypothetical protein